MLDMIRARKAQLKERGYKGFTLMEMLIVVAIIAVLVAIAIPVFTGQLNRARAATDAANIRSGYATAMAYVLENNPDDGATYTLNSDGSVSGTGITSTGTTYTTQAGSDDLDSDENTSIGGQTVTWSKGQSVTYTWNGSSLAISAS